MGILSEMLYNAFYKSKEDYIIEGLICNFDNHTVSLTDENTDGVDFSLKTNPTFYEMKGMKIISLFRRTELITPSGKDDDGSPFIKALKKIDKWRFEMSNEDIDKYLKRVFSVMSKIPKTYDTILVVKSEHGLNKLFMNRVKRYFGIPDSRCIEDLFVKSTVTDAENSISQEEIEDWVYQNYPNSYDYMLHQVQMEIQLAFKRMRKEGRFYQSKIMPKHLNRFIHSIMTINHDIELGKLSEIIDDKNVLILDDTISTGSSVSPCVEAIRANFSPKSLTVITLLSKKFKK